jgi:hypothetical protein
MADDPLIEGLKGKREQVAEYLQRLAAGGRDDAFPPWALEVFRGSAGKTVETLDTLIARGEGPANV